MSAPISFIPKKAMPFDSKLFNIIGAGETLEIARHTMTLLPTPPFPADAIIHDAACGLGPVTESILATAPAPTIKIHATDITPPMINVYNQSAEARHWPCRAEIMDAQKLAFPDATFSHVFLSFGLPIMNDPVAAAREMYRTLRPGGTAVTAFWLHNPQGECGVKVCRAIRGPDARLNIEPNPQHTDKGYIRSLCEYNATNFTLPHLSCVGVLHNALPRDLWQTTNTHKWSKGDSSSRTASCTSNQLCCMCGTWTISPLRFGALLASQRVDGPRRMMSSGMRRLPSTRSSCPGSPGTRWTAMEISSSKPLPKLSSCERMCDWNSRRQERFDFRRK